MIPNLFILSTTGDVLIEKQWIGKLKRNVCELFWEETSSPSAAFLSQPHFASPSSLAAALTSSISATATLSNSSTSDSSSSSAPSTNGTNGSSSTSSSSPANASGSSSSSPSSSSSSSASSASALPRIEVPPVVQTAKHTFISTYRAPITFLVVTSRDTSPLAIIEFLQSLAAVFVQYLGEYINETCLRENFSVVFQLLDEMVDGGFPATTEPNQLTEMIAPPSFANKLLREVTGEFAVSDRLPMAAVSKIPWRKVNVKYVTNKVFFDIVEQVDAIVTPNQGMISSCVFGEIRANCMLSGMPDLTLTFSQPSLLDDVALHRCVRINRFQRERVVSFVPPDGAFQLLSYRVNDAVQLPLYVKPTITFRPGGGRVNVMVGSRTTPDKPVQSVVVRIPLPRTLRSHSLSCNVGRFNVDAHTQVCTWTVGDIPREITPMLEGGLVLAGETVPDELPTLSADFAVKYAVSGLKVDGLSVRNVNYKPFKGLRAMSIQGRLQIRCTDL